MENPVSIIVTAWNVKNYIESCLDSISEQDYFEDNPFEILVGVDYCYDTLTVLNDIKHKYKNLSIYWNWNNVGTYITSNSLISNIKYNHVIRFDSDDLMFPNMVSTLFREMDRVEGCNQVRCSCSYMNEDGTPWKGDVKQPQHPDGVCLFKTEVFRKLGGFMPWRCAADTELTTRGKANHIIAPIKIPNRLFMRRLHKDSLTQSPETCRTSPLRAEYRKYIVEESRKKLYIKPTLANCEKVY